VPEFCSRASARACLCLCACFLGKRHMPKVGQNNIYTVYIRRVGQNRTWDSHILYIRRI